MCGRSVICFHVVLFLPASTVERVKCFARVSDGAAREFYAATVREDFVCAKDVFCGCWAMDDKEDAH